MVWPLVAASAISAGAGIFGANQAANAQADAARDQARTARRNMLVQLGMAEPQRNVGYQALGDLASLYGYSMPEYSTLNQLTATLTPISSKNMAKALRNGATFEQLQQMGTLEGSLNPKAVKRLTRAGLTMEQIQQLGAGQNLGGAAPGAPAAGTPGTPATGQLQAGNMSRFFTSPDYTFRRDEGQRDIGNSFAARGGAASGNALRALSEFNGNLASAEYGNYTNRLMQMAGMGQVANQGVSSASNNYTNQLMNTQQQAGDARASGILGATNGVVNSINTGLNNWLMSRYLNQPQNSPYGPYSGGYQLPPYATPPFNPGSI